MDKELLAADLEKYRQVIMIARSFPYKDRVYEMLSSFSDVMAYIPDVDKERAAGNIRHISADEERELLQLYHTYEFSDRFTVFEVDERFGSVWNYVETGILTLDEALRSQLGT